jgi:hypothetical protein
MDTVLSIRLCLRISVSRNCFIIYCQNGLVWSWGSRKWPDVFPLLSCGLWAGIAQSVWRLTTGWTVRGSNSGGGEFLRTCPDRPWGPPSLLYNECRLSFLGVKQPGRGVNHLPHLLPRLKKEYSYICTPLWAFMAGSRVNFTFYLWAAVFTLFIYQFSIPWFVFSSSCF